MNTKNKIKKLLTLAILAMALVSFTAGAAETIYEPFDYTAGTNLTGSGGIGFDGAWSTSSYNSAPLFWVQAPGLTFTDSSYEDINAAGNSASRASWDERAEASRVLSAASQTALLADGSTMWFSMLYQRIVPNWSGNALIIGTDTFDVAAGWDLNCFPAGGEGFGIGSTDDSLVTAFSYDDTAGLTEVDSTVDANSVKLIAGEIVWNANGTDDIMYLYNVTDLATEPTTPIVTITADLDQSNFNRLSMFSNSAEFVYDEIRLGKTFADVSPHAPHVPDTTSPTVTALNPGDNSNCIMDDDFDLVMTFDEQIAKGTGNITIKNITDANEIVIPVGDAQVSISVLTLTINPTVDFIVGKDYAIQIDATAIKDLADNTYAGIADDTTWNFTTISLDGLNSNLLVYEPFDYEAGNIDPNLLVNEETGLTGAWEVVSGEGVAPVIQEGSVGYYGLPVTGGSWNDGEGVWQQWHIEADLDPATLDGYLEDGDELWFSFTCYIPFLNQLTPENSHQLRIGTDEDNYIGIYPNKTERFGPGQFQAIISADGIQTVGSTSVLFEENTHLYVGRVLFGSTDTVEAYMPDIDLALPAAPLSTVTGSVDQSTFAKVRSIIHNGNSMSSDEIRFGTTYGSVIGYPFSPDVYAGDNMVSWSGGEAQLAPTVVNNDPGDPQMPLAYTWTHDAPEGYTVVFNPGPNVEDPTVTITKDADTGDATVITLQLTASNVGGTAPHFAAMKANMTMDLYDDACQAFKAVGMTINDSDFNADCDTDLTDFAVMAQGWLVDYTLTEPTPKP